MPAFDERAVGRYVDERHVVAWTDVGRDDPVLLDPMMPPRAAPIANAPTGHNGFH